VSKHWKLN